MPDGLTNSRTGQAFGGWVYSDQVKSLDYRERSFDFICRAPFAFVEEILDHLLTLLDPQQT